MQRFDGLTFARQGLQVATLVVVPLVLVPALVGVLILVPHIGNIEWLFVLITMACIGLIAWASIKAYFAWAVVPCTVDVGNNEIVITLHKRTLFYPYRQKIITPANIINASCNMDVRLGKSFVNIKTYKPKATYMLQYLDDRADDPNPVVWTNIEALINVYNQNQGTNQITNVGFFEGGAVKWLMYICGVFLVAFAITMIVDSNYRTTDHYFKLGYFAFVFAGLYYSIQYAKKQRNKKG